MCLALFSHNHHPDYRLVIASNRDEFYERSTTTADWWEDHPHIVGGRDLKAGGTWFGVSKNGRFALVTNYRQFPVEEGPPLSRGHLVSNFLSGDQDVDDYLVGVREHQDQYQGFNLLVGFENQIGYFSNRGGFNPDLSPGVYGLSNHLLDTPWPKVEQGKRDLQHWLATNPDPEAGFDWLHNEEQAPDEDLPDTGIGLDWERRLSSLYIRSENYGTRCSTLLMVDKEGKVTFRERSYVPQKDSAFSFYWP